MQPYLDIRMASLMTTAISHPDPRITVTTDLFQISSGACSLAISIANLGASVVSLTPEPTSTVMIAQSISNPDIAGIGVSSYGFKFRRNAGN